MFTNTLREQRKQVATASNTLGLFIIGIQPLGRSGQRPELSQVTGMAGTLHPGQVLRDSLPLLSPAF